MIFPATQIAMAAALGLLTLAGACSAGASAEVRAESEATSERGAHGDPALRRQVSITFEQAQAAALAQRPGAVREWELEREAGGSGLRYSFVIAQGGQDYEVGIDASNGAILENASESANPD